MIAKRTKARQRVEALEKACLLIEASYGDDLLALMQNGPAVQLGDVLPMPEGHPEAEIPISLWELVWLLDACREKLETDLAQLEKTP